MKTRSAYVDYVLRVAAERWLYVELGVSVFIFSNAVPLQIRDLRTKK